MWGYFSKTLKRVKYSGLKKEIIMGKSRSVKIRDIRTQDIILNSWHICKKQEPEKGKVNYYTYEETDIRERKCQ